VTDSLRREMERFLHDWRDDLSPAWSQFLDGAEPALDAINPALTFDIAEPVIPGRRDEPYPDAPAGAHVFRALDAIDPADVSVVVIGQDPYPRLTRATGRAFEDGELTDWGGKVAASLQRLMQSALALRHNRTDWAQGPGGWSAIRQAYRDGDLPLEPSNAYFDRLQSRHGVLFVNAGWTLTRFVPGGGEEQKAHIAPWRPVMTALLAGLAEREQGSIVYLLLGGFARSLFDATDIEARARDEGRWGTRVAKVVHPHPSALGSTGYFAAGNPLDKVNRALGDMDATPVDW